jgi:hypothetical protein
MAVRAKKPPKGRLKAKPKGLSGMTPGQRKASMAASRLKVAKSGGLKGVQGTRKANAAATAARKAYNASKPKVKTQAAMTGYQRFAFKARGTRLGRSLDIGLKRFKQNARLGFEVGRASVSGDDSRLKKLFKKGNARMNTRNALKSNAAGRLGSMSAKNLANSVAMGYSVYGGFAAGAVARIKKARSKRRQAVQDMRRSGRKISRVNRVRMSIGSTSNKLSSKARNWSAKKKAAMKRLWENNRKRK